ncbi:unnamed protein product, partial [Allacma fusca]
SAATSASTETAATTSAASSTSSGASGSRISPSNTAGDAAKSSQTVPAK